MRTISPRARAARDEGREWMQWLTARSLRDLRLPLFWLGLALPVCFVAGITGASIPTQGPLLSIVLSIAWWKNGSPFHWIAITILSYAALSLLWAVNPIDSAFGLWQVALWALGFWLGTAHASLGPLWRGMAVGLGVSSAVAVAQACGWNAIPVYDHPAGLLYSGSMQSAMIALVALALVCDRAWLYLPAMAPGFYLAHSRGGWLILVIGLLTRIEWTVAAFALLAAGVVVFVDPGESDQFRMLDWSIAAHSLHLFGSGIGSFIDVLYQIPGEPGLHPVWVHNDYLQLAFELGVGAIPIYLVIARCLARTEAHYWPVFVAFATLALFFFPLYSAALAFVGTVVAGHMLRGDDPGWLAGVLRRSALMAWLRHRQHARDETRGAAVSDLAGIAPEERSALDAAL